MIFTIRVDIDDTAPARFRYIAYWGSEPADDRKVDKGHGNSPFAAMTDLLSNYDIPEDMY